MAAGDLDIIQEDQGLPLQKRGIDMKGVVPDKPDPFLRAELAVIFLIGNGAMDFGLLHDGQPVVREPSVQPEDKMIFHGEGCRGYERVRAGDDYDLLPYRIQDQMTMDETIGQAMPKCRCYRLVPEFEPAIVIGVETKPVPVRDLM
jgi:hypothetical protein